jgi:hypothetical protein
MTSHLTRSLTAVLWAAGILCGPASVAFSAPLPAKAVPTQAAAPILATAQSPTAQTGTIVVAAHDALDGFLPGATITVTRPDAQAAEPLVMVTNATGEATLDSLAPGRYVLQVAMPGFENGTLDVEVARGQTVRRVIKLAISGFAEHVAVKADEAETPGTDGFSETLEAEEIDQLPDSSEELTQLLQQMAGGDEAEFRVNGFQGDELPPKAQIQAIRIRQDPFSADSHGAGRPRIEITTKPGSTEWTHEIDAGLRDQSLDARNALAPERGKGQTRRASWTLRGPLIKNRTSLSARIFGNSVFEAQTIVAKGASGSFNDVVSHERGRFDAEVRVDHALTPTHTLRVEFQRRNYTGDNLGVGDFDLPERAYAEDRRRQIFRVSETATVGTKLFNEFRVEFSDDIQTTDSLSNARTIDVQNAFTSGGAQRQGGLRGREVEVGNSLELIASDRHKIRIGFEGEFGRSTSDLQENAAGTFTFGSLEDYEAGRPLQFVQRTGDPRVQYSRYEFSWWAQDERRLGENLQIGLGIRHDFQGFLDDRNNFAPRASLAWTPFAGGKTTIEAGAGVFNDWYSPDIYEQTLRLDGQRQRDLIVRNPGFPDPLVDGADAELPPPSVVRAGDDLHMQTARRVSVGIEHRATKQIRLRLNVFGQFTNDRFRSLNVNAPVNGDFPDPDFGRITEIRSIGRAEQRGFDASVRMRSGDRGPSGMFHYRYARAWNDADGALSLPQDSGNLAAEWGPASRDIRHRIFGFLRMPLPLGFRANLSAEVESGAPYTIRTGFDDNGDTVPNDRPAGIGRNSARGTWQKNVDLRLDWSPWEIGRGGRDGARGGRDGARGANRRGLELYARVSNLLNETNYTRFTGVVTSPFFGRPTGAGSPRRFDMGLRVFF